MFFFILRNRQARRMSQNVSPIISYFTGGNVIMKLKNRMENHYLESDTPFSAINHCHTNQNPAGIIMHKCGIVLGGISGWQGNGSEVIPTKRNEAEINDAPRKLGIW